MREHLQARFAAQLDSMVERHLAVTPHGVVPNHHFAAASAECIDCFRSGHFIACVTLVQAVAEGIARLVCLKTAIRTRSDQNQRVHRLRTANIVSAVCATAFQDISAAQRDDFHHMNPAVPTHHRVLEELAKKALRDLATIEAEVFAFDIVAGRLQPKNPLLWDIGPEGTVPVFLRGP